ncbi:hypothetical protein [Bosea sp. BIWAKO-01]|uniref:hypothetical protein n=1 Tax=Bosea sp. BIWAKO-01 TaxID=506668 RepID=UPI000852E7A7|nr:hypothetical protein [Bosea sp. BIWAKO-01]GAU86175.1 hypothetical protein BIWAKO_06123 [Bosea sp. BIWAKO-01]
MRPKVSTVLAALVFASGLGVTGYAVANPGAALCAASGIMPLSRLHDGTLVEYSASDPDHPATVQRLLSDAKGRIGEIFGEPRSAPIVVFFNDATGFWPFRLNVYGSTEFIGARTCVLIGPKGQTIDVVAHELMHAEIADRIGIWARYTDLPTWFDEGLAMQVDFRPDYDMPGGANVETKSVRALRSPREFFVPDDRQLTRNYAFAKAETALWARRVGYASVYAELERVRRGEPFEIIAGTN